jgi:hypothetical protein
MIEGILVLVGVGVFALAYFICAMWRHHTCDIGKLFTLLTMYVGLVTGIHLYLRAYEAFRATHAYSEDIIWGGIAGVVLCLASASQVFVSFKELFATRVDPVKVRNDNTPTE